jgi:hypothetical protein
VRRQFDQHFTLILGAMFASKGATLHKAINEFDCAVVTETELLRKRGDGGTAALRQPLDCEENLMLLGFNSLGTGRLFAEAQELPDTVTELGETPKAKF